MQKIKCEECGREVPAKEISTVFDMGTSQAKSICRACYYAKIAEWQSMVSDLERRTTDDDNADD